MAKPRKRKTKGNVVKAALPANKEESAQVVPQVIEAAIPEKHETLDEALESPHE